MVMLRKTIDFCPGNFRQSGGLARIQISNGLFLSIIVSFPYGPRLIARVMTIDGLRWQPSEKYCGFPNRKDINESILKVFARNEVQIYPALSSRSAEKIFEYACPKVQIGKNVSVHTLKHTSLPIFWRAEMI